MTCLFTRCFGSLVAFDFINRMLDNLSSLNNQQKVFNDVLRQLFIHNMLSQLYNEIVWLWKYYLNTFLQEKQQILAKINFDQDSSNDSDVSMEFIGNSRMKLMKQWRMATDFYDCWITFCQCLWPTRYTQRLTQIYKTCVESMDNKELPLHWQSPLPIEKFKPLWEDLFNAKTAWNKYKLKSFFGQINIRCGLANYYYTYSCLKWSPQILEKDKQCKWLWDLQTSIWYVLCLAASWPQICAQWWPSNEFVNHEWLIAKNGYGLQSCLLGIFYVFGLYYPSKFYSRDDFIRSIVPTEYWGIMSRMQDTFIPIAFKCNELETEMWNKNKDLNHPSSKLSPLTFYVAFILFFCHDNIIRKYFGQAKYLKNAHWGSTKLVKNAENQQKSIEYVHNALVPDSFKLEEKEETAIRASFAKFGLLKFDYNKPAIPGLTKYSLNFIVQSMYNLKYNTSSNKCSKFAAFLFCSFCVFVIFANAANLLHFD